jgi:RNA ligase
MKLSDLMNIDDLDREILDGFVRVRTHPHDPDTQIFNYTEKAQYEKHWNYVTKQCRGLIHRRGEVLARPFDKFFNLGEHDYDTSDVFAPDRLVEMTDKMDGSLGILYPWPGDGFKMRHQWAIATRGSFESEQAIHATDVLRNKYPDFKPAPGFTYLFEIVYPENRIVLDYGDQDDLILLGMRNIDRGFIVGPQSSVATSAWPGAVTDFWGYMSFSKAT